MIRIKITTGNGITTTAHRSQIKIGNDSSRGVRRGLVVRVDPDVDETDPLPLPSHEEEEPSGFAIPTRYHCEEQAMMRSLSGDSRSATKMEEEDHHRSSRIGNGKLRWIGARWPAKAFEANAKN
nr:uncharacterized protein LOC115268128 [Aedes albopictus]